MQFNQFQHFIGQCYTASFCHALSKWQISLQSVRQMIDIHKLSKHFTVTTDAAEACACDVYPVIAFGTTNKFGFGWLTFNAPVGFGHFDRSIG